MSNERTSEDPSWNARLEMLGQLPGADEGWKEAAWDKLYARLQPEEAVPQKKRALWYWAAAACLGFAVLVSLAVLRPGKSAERRENGLGQGASNGAGSGRLPVTGSRVEKPEIAGSVVVPSVNTTVRHSVNTADSSGEPRKKVFVTTKNAISPGEADVGKDNATMGIAMIPGTDSPGNRMQLPAEPIILAAAPMVHQRLRVVYVNELNGPAAAEEPSGHIASRGIFPIHLPFSGPSRNLLTGMESAGDPAREIPPLFKISLKN